tara:strand:+ start:348 stop:575 length:228 start_codon:yes stop_codon:yes gene_type:complete
LTYGKNCDILSIYGGQNVFEVCSEYCHRRRRGLLGRFGFLWCTLLYLRRLKMVGEYVVMVGLGFIIGMVVTMGVM